MNQTTETELLAAVTEKGRLTLMESIEFEDNEQIIVTMIGLEVEIITPILTGRPTNLEAWA